MSYLNLDLNYFEHIKTIRLIALLGKGSEVIPIKLWCHCGKHHPKDGAMVGYSAQEIEFIAGWSGTPGEMVKSLVKIAFLDVIKNGWKIHGWTDTEGHLVAFHKRAKTAARARWNKYANVKISNATSIAKVKDKQCPILSYPTNPTIPNKSNGDCASPFESFWKEYPKKRGKDAAARIWKRRKLDDIITVIMDALAVQQGCQDWRREEGKFIPNPATWLNQGRWQDEVLQKKSAGAWKPEWEEERKAACRSVGVTAKGEDEESKKGLDVVMGMIAHASPEAMQGRGIGEKK